MLIGFPCVQAGLNLSSQGEPCASRERHARARGPVDREAERLGAMAGQKIRIRLKSYDHEVIDSSARKIVDVVTRAGATVVGPVPLPRGHRCMCRMWTML